jgi:hypothetical protein
LIFTTQALPLGKKLKTKKGIGTERENDLLKAKA